MTPSETSSSSPTLWQNADQTITLLDIPRSISAAQGTQECPCHDLLITSEPRQRPYKTLEPKSEARRARLKGNSVEESLHDEYRKLLQPALDEVRKSHHGGWYIPRLFVVGTDMRPNAKKRKLNEDEAAEAELTAKTKLSSHQPLAPPENMFANITTRENVTPKAYYIQFHDDAEAEEAETEDVRFRSNRSFNTIGFDIARAKTPSGPDSYTYRMPPNSSFYLGDCSDPRPLHVSIRNQAQAQDTRRHFDFILLDPPWPNSSVKRTHKTPGSNYKTLRTLDDVYDLLANMDLDMLMPDDCLIGIWVTNKPAIREMILGEDGLFAFWGVGLEEEWIWLKIAANGDTVTPLDALWRKPYEVLLLGRKRRIGTHSGEEPSLPKRKVIIAVPDLHSRKPCLKELIEPLMPSPDYRALEVFARHLVAGWWSWGNECIKFNLDGDWRTAVELEAVSKAEKT